MNSRKHIVILGGGPCGLGACLRLQQLGHSNWTLIEQNDHVGGLASSFEDNKGFLWDVGGHVIFSHYQYFNDVTSHGVKAFTSKNRDRYSISDNDLVHADEHLWQSHKRAAWIRFSPDAWVPYPFQTNFYLANDTQVTRDCITGLLELHANPSKEHSTQLNFDCFVQNTFGCGIVKHFMEPYNLKVWGFPLNQLGSTWIGDRVARNFDLAKIVERSLGRSSPLDCASNWGPNSHFRYPKYGGTGSIWRGVGELLDPKNVRLGHEVIQIDVDEKRIHLANATTINYDYIISTLPIDALLLKTIKQTGKLDIECLFAKHQPPMYSSTHIVGLGFAGRLPDNLRDKSWIYCASNRSPFYRISILSNHSSFMVPEPGNQWSLMFEMSSTPVRPLNVSNAIENTIDGAIKEAIITDVLIMADEENIVSKYYSCFEHGYPTPYLARDAFLSDVEPRLRGPLSIWSRGRFGGWRYEVSNQDHAVMQGVEAVDNILFGCEEQTYFYPDHVNTRKETTRRFNLAK